MSDYPKISTVYLRAAARNPKGATLLGLWRKAFLGGSYSDVKALLNWECWILLAIVREGWRKPVYSESVVQRNIRGEGGHLDPHYMMHEAGINR